MPLGMGLDFWLLYTFGFCYRCFIFTSSFFSVGDSSKTDIIIRGKSVGSVPDVRFYKYACLGECADLADKLAYFECTEKVLFLIEVNFFLQQLT